MKEESFKYCPKCGAESLQEKKTGWLKCKACGFDFFTNPKPACVAVIFNENNELLMVKRAIDPYKDWWDLPGGFIDRGETPEDTIKRELKEELGIEIEIEDYLWSVPDDYKYKDMIYEALDLTFLCSFEGNPKPADDVSDFRFFEINSLPEKITPHHAKHIKGIIESRIYLNS